ncbi:BA75_02719T0 [Komagataella pastoris]|uniref:BA75_02719T0 n=1 Tax=Komagataella pastoris TaxID=4922 RepID=A0A1B2JC58_PICPA|nr:BA75_02719T0 [Komagataella pastoris]
MRHGFQDEYTSQQYMDMLANTFYIYYDDKRHETAGNPTTEEEKEKNYKKYQPIVDWKIMKDRQKTVSAAIVLCLNIGVDPPDILKTQPSAKTEAWVDPLSFTDNKKAIESIGRALQTQYETLSLRTRYKQSLDPCVEDVKRFCNTLRKTAKDERILFHYNGHGVPQPTQSGEIWVFNRGYTQYIPISLYDLQTWLGAPCIFVYDCSSAGNIVTNFKKFVQKRIDDDNDGNHDISAPSPTAAYIDCIQLAACRSSEILPMNPDLPADLFTCCLTCPIEISVKWFLLQSPLKFHGYYDLLLDQNGQIQIPGKLTDRRTPLGELNWIFTAITDTIAWSSLPRAVFKKLFRQDLMVAALFRNFLLAKKIMTANGCNPISDPPLPDITDHTMWDSWDLAIDQVLSQLVKNHEKLSRDPTASTNTLLRTEPSSVAPTPVSTTTSLSDSQDGNQTPQKPPAPTPSQSQGQIINNYQHSTFFEHHLTAFEIWLKYGSSSKNPPDQLPIVLQVLLSQVHRLRALILLSRFLDLGPWAVYLALSIGIFPYILKLLQSPAQELKPVLTFIWARIMSIDHKNTQQELCKDKGYNYFIQILVAPKPTTAASGNHFLVNDVNYEEHKAMSAFILSLFVKEYKPGQRLCFSSDLVGTCLYYLEKSGHPLLRQWCALLTGQLWANYPDGRWISYKDGHVERLTKLLNDPIPEVRASIVISLTNFLTTLSDDEEPSTMMMGKEESNQQEVKVALSMLFLLADGSPIVRREVVVFFSKFVMKYIHFFIVSACGQLEEEITLIDDPSMIDEVRRRSVNYGTIYSSVFKTLLIMSSDPDDGVKDYAQCLVDFIMIRLNQSPLGEIVSDMEQYLLQRSSTNDTTQLKSDQASLHGLGMVSNGNQLRIHKTRDPSHSKTGSRSQSLKIISSKNSTTITPLFEGNQQNGHNQRSVSNVSTNSLSDRMSNLALNWLRNFSGTSNRNIQDNDSHLAPVDLSHLYLGYGIEPIPPTPRFVPLKQLTPISEPKMPLHSKFFEYSMEYFQEPQIGVNDVDEPGSFEYTRRLWRRNRNESIINETQPQKDLAISGDWNNNIATFNNTTQPKLLKFTQFDSYLVSADEKDNITCFNWETNEQLSRFSNNNPFGTKITDMKFINEDDNAMLLTGSSDGVVRIYKNFQSMEDIRLATAWRALTDLLLTSRTTGLVSEWQQSTGSLLVSGDVKIIRIWDAPRELCVVDIPARSTSSITSLTSDQVAGNIFVGGFGDGTIRVYDRRLDSRDSMVKIWQNRESRGMIKNIHMQRGGHRELMSASNNMVNLWDIRLDKPIESFPHRSITTALIHEHAPVILTASKIVNVATTTGEHVSTIRDPSPYLSNKTAGYVSSMMLHPHRMMVATSHTQDCHIQLYKCTDKLVQEHDGY